MQAWGKENDFSSGDGQLAGLVALALLLLGVRSAGITAYTDDITTAQMYVLGLEIGSTFLYFLGLGEDLQPGALGTEVVEEKLRAGGPLDEYPAGKLDGLGLV